MPLPCLRFPLNRKRLKINDTMKFISKLMVPAFCIMLGAIEVSAYTSLLPGDFNEDGIVNFDDVFNQPVTDENRKYDLA